VATLNLDFNDLAIIVNGKPDDEGCNHPFDCHFTKEKILRSWAKVGFVPFTQKCLANVKVRRELGQHVQDARLERLQFNYDVLVDVLESMDGINPGIFSSSIPTAMHVARAETEDEQVEALIKAGKAFSASGQEWNMCDSRIGNAAVTLKAQKPRRSSFS
jgi:hypothetical protein